LSTNAPTQVCPIRFIWAQRFVIWHSGALYLPVNDMKVLQHVLCCLLLSLPLALDAATLPELPSVELTPAEQAEVQKLVLPVPENWTGDFEGMRERRLVRVLVTYSKTFFELDRGRHRGLSYELG